MIRKCPNCNNDIVYTHKKSYRYAIKNNSRCRKCVGKDKLGIPRSDEVKEKIRNATIKQFENGMPEKDKQKISKTLKIKFNTPKMKEKFRKQNGGENNPMYGRNHSAEVKEKNRKSALKQFENGMSEEDKQKISQSLKGRKRKPFSNEWRKNMRLSTKKRIEKNKFNGGQMTPGYNPVACGIINDYNKKHGFNFQHAENGGEVCIDGYWPDGLDEKRKTIIEVDEKHHFNSDGKLKQKDIQRQNYLENLGYKIIRIKFNGDN